MTEVMRLLQSVRERRMRDRGDGLCGVCIFVLGVLCVLAFVFLSYAIAHGP